ncbi:MAG: hypothetical protein WD738_18180 [Pirellulales bacterium]
MPHENQSRETTFGYLSTVHTAEDGYFGGYLIVSVAGRPLEFHCTSPVRPSWAQEILYGPTLQPYLVGEQIGGVLLAAAKLTPHVILTNQPAMLAVRPRVGVPMALIVSADESVGGRDGEAAFQSGAASSGNGTPRLSEPSYGQFRVGRYELQLPAGFESDEQAVVESIGLASRHLDLVEPFGRIHDAIREARRIGGQTLESHDQAA